MERVASLAGRRGLLGCYGLKTLKGNRISGGRVDGWTGGRRRLRTLNSGRRRGEEEDRQASERASNGGREGGRESQSSCSVGRGIASLSNSTMKQKKAPFARSLARPFAFVPGSFQATRSSRAMGAPKSPKYIFIKTLKGLIKFIR